MKASFTVLALAGSALAGGYEGYPAPSPSDVYVTKTVPVEVTYTTVCPVTSVVSEPGKTYTQIYTTTSTVVTKVDTTLYETVKGPDVTQTKGEQVYETITSLCPVTETKTVEGFTVVVTWTSTSTLTQVVPTTAIAYTSYTVTKHVETEVYTTEICPETVYTTVSAGSTIYITETGTETVTQTKEYTVVETIPVTATTEVETTVTQELSTGVTATAYPTVWVTKNGTAVVSSVKTYSTLISSPVTLSTVAPVTTSPSPTTSIPTALAARATQAVGVVLAGVAGFMVMM